MKEITKQEAVEKVRGFIGDFVFHKDLGMGKIISSYDLFFTVQFADTTKRFEYPLAFITDELRGDIEVCKIVEYKKMSEEEAERILSESVGTAVYHKMYGMGRIVEHNGLKFKVSFENKTAEFQYPQAFKEDFLRGNVPVCDVQYKPKEQNKTQGQKAMFQSFLGQTHVQSATQAQKRPRRFFFVFQGLQYDHELNGGYIFAGLEPVPHWERLREIQKGDILFHCAGQYVKAISVAQGSAYIASRPLEHYLASDKEFKKGLMVDLDYIVCNKPLDIGFYRETIKKLQGDNTGMGYPFNKNGTGNQGYCFNLKKSLVEFFIKELVIRNPKNDRLQKIAQEIQ